MRERPVPVKYAVGLVKDSRLQPGGLMYEIVCDDGRRLIAGFVFTGRSGVRDYRGVDGHLLSSGQWTVKGAERQRLEALRTGFDLAITEYAKEKGKNSS